MQRTIYKCHTTQEHDMQYRRAADRSPLTTLEMLQS